MADSSAFDSVEKSADESEPSWVASSVEKKVETSAEMSVAMKDEREPTTAARSAVQKVGSWVFLMAAMLVVLMVDAKVALTVVKQAAEKAEPTGDWRVDLSAAWSVGLSAAMKERK